MSIYGEIKKDKRYKVRKFFRVSKNGKIQFSDEYDEKLGFIGITKDSKLLKLWAN